MSEAQPKKHYPWYTVAKILGTIAVHTICPVTYRHTERLRREGPCIFICNHQSWMDPVVVALPVKKRQVTFLGKKELTGNPILRTLVLGMRMIVVDRHNSDMEAMRACMRVIREGGILGIFPEGTRHHRGVMEELENGASLIALRSKAPVIPIYIDREVKPFHHTNCYVGEPIPTDDLIAQGVNRETSEQLTERIRAYYADWILRAKAGDG